MGLNIISKQQDFLLDYTSFLGDKKENGLGLLKELVNLMKGQIVIQHKEGQAATFVITIPNTTEYATSDTFSSSTFPRVEELNNNEFTIQKYSPRQNSFLQKLQVIVEENIEDETFGITQLCRAANLSRSQLHNKIKANTGLSTSIYVRLIRLQKAKQLLENSDMNVSEVAYSVGFKDPSYFSRLFTEKYGITPTKIRKL